MFFIKATQTVDVDNHHTDNHFSNVNNSFERYEDSLFRINTQKKATSNWISLSGVRSNIQYELLFSIGILQQVSPVN